MQPVDIDAANVFLRMLDTDEADGGSELNVPTEETGRLPRLEIPGTATAKKPSKKRGRVEAAAPIRVGARSRKQPDRFVF